MTYFALRINIATLENEHAIFPEIKTKVVENYSGDSRKYQENRKDKV